MQRKFAYPSGHWSLKVEIPYSMGVRASELIILAGQVDMKGNGEVQHPNDLHAQTEASIGHIKRLQRVLDNDADYVTPHDMLAELRSDNMELNKHMRTLHELCDEHGDVATASLIENWIDETEQRVWFLFETGRRTDG